MLNAGNEPKQAAQDDDAPVWVMTLRTSRLAFYANSFFLRKRPLPHRAPSLPLFSRFYL